jgi:hypothetical protein
VSWLDLHGFSALSSEFLIIAEKLFQERTKPDSRTFRPCEGEFSGSATAQNGVGDMKGLTMLGAILLVLGLLAFVVPIPHKEDHGVKIGDAKIGVQTEHSDRLPPLVAGVLVLAGVVSLAAGARKSV